MMRGAIRLAVVFGLFFAASPSRSAQADQAVDVVLAVHGGTGMDKKDMTPELDRAFRAGLDKALRAGFKALNLPSATGLDGIEAAIRVLEDDPNFNAGRGAVLTHDSRIELDASVMEGAELRAGAVAGVTTVKNPISLARAVMEKTKHVMLIGRGAEAFAAEAGLKLVDPSYFRTERRLKQLQDELREERKKTALPRNRPHQWGTVGAVALDRAGHLASGTSTGGMSNKRYGRVGDSPIIGAGTYAADDACAVSATGHGEYFIRYSVARDIADRIRYKGIDVFTAAREVVLDVLVKAGGEGGVIALDPKGNLSMPFNSEGLYRGYITKDGTVVVRLYEN